MDWSSYNCGELANCFILYSLRTDATTPILMVSWRIASSSPCESWRTIGFFLNLFPSLCSEPRSRQFLILGPAGCSQTLYGATLDKAAGAGGPGSGWFVLKNCPCSIPIFSREGGLGMVTICLTHLVRTIGFELLMLNSYMGTFTYRSLCRRFTYQINWTTSCQKLNLTWWQLMKFNTCDPYK